MVNNTSKVLISSCLLGNRVRYDGGCCPVNHPRLAKWIEQGRVVSICPEMAGGLSALRLPAEIIGSDTGLGVFNGTARVFDCKKNDVTAQFVDGAKAAVELAKKNNIRVVILKESSPSCGSKLVYDGTFKNKKISGVGVTTAYLQEAGVAVFSEFQIDEALDIAEQ